MMRNVLLFSLGRIVATPGAMEALERNQQQPRTYLCRHATGDWGTVCDEDAEANRNALETGARVLSAYALPDGTDLWIITEAADHLNRRTLTTLLLPSEY
jgi:rhamnogalacturonyl hydrolase YesR